jgi:two-component system nitrogen regulation sensor histidine kinase GlnL
MVTSKPNGTGLGLSIAQDIVAQHGGVIECSSLPGRTIFRIYLPLENGHG